MRFFFLICTVFALISPGHGKNSKTIEGYIKVAAHLKNKIGPGGVLFVFAKRKGQRGGPPVRGVVAVVFAGVELHDHFVLVETLAQAAAVGRVLVERGCFDVERALAVVPLRVKGHAE